MTRITIIEAVKHGKIEVDECPGCPCAGGCEFCPTHDCVTHLVDGVELTEDDLDTLRDIENEAEREEQEAVSA